MADDDRKVREQLEAWSAPGSGPTPAERRNAARTGRRAVGYDVGIASLAGSGLVISTPGLGLRLSPWWFALTGIGLAAMVFITVSTRQWRRYMRRAIAEHDAAHAAEDEGAPADDAGH